MPHFDCKILTLLLLLSACKNERALENQLIVRVEQAALRAEPNEKSREIRSLLKGQTLTDLGRVGASESQVAVGCDIFQTPWLKVQTAESQTGWVLAWALEPSQKQADWLLQKRLICYFGDGLAVRRNQLIQDFANLQTEAQLAETWRKANVLRDTFLQLLSRRPESGFQPEFNWLNEVVPGFLFQKIGENEAPYLFADYQVLQQKALKTKGLQDDAFFQIYLAAFPKDGVESFSPVWKFPLSDTESVSQLGTGQHLKMLQQLDRSVTARGLFAAQMDVFKDQVLEDVFGKKQQYWQPQEKILEELGQILSNPPSCLDSRELETLGIRQKMFEAPDENGIVLNLRSGE